MTEPELDPSAELPDLQLQGEEEGGLPPWIKGILAVVVVYLFIAAVNMIGAGLKCIARDDAGRDFLQWLFGLVSDQPMMGLFIGILATSIVQSSSFTTSMTVGLVAVGDISLVSAIPIVMGANIGTSVTNILVSLANMRRPLQFRRSLEGAIVHDFFNVLSVIVILPLEVAFGIISRPAGMISSALGGTRFFQSDINNRMGFLKKAFGLVGNFFRWLLVDVFGLSPTFGGAVIAILALILLFVALWLLVMLLRGLLLHRLSGMFSRTIFRRPGIAFVAGIVTTASVQSSSVTTSLLVPLVGAGVLKLRQIYPYTLGANIGTTITAMLAALGTGSAAAMACAFAHLLFNLYGTIVFWPLQFIPISLAKGFAKLASRRRLVAALYIIVFFFVLPLLVILITNL